MLEFPQGLMSLIAVRAVRAVAEGPLVRHSLAEIPRLVPDVQMRIVAIYRQDKALADLDGDTGIEPGDEVFVLAVFVLAATEHIRRVPGALRMRDLPVKPVKRVMLAGGGKVALRLAREIHGNLQIKIIEPLRLRCDCLATELTAEVLVLHGDSTDEDLLGDQSVDEMDLFLALSNDDEDHIMSCLLAERLGARRVLALINRRA